MTPLALAAPVADVWARSVAAGDLDSATWLGVVTATAMTAGGVAAGLAQRTRQPRTRTSMP